MLLESIFMIRGGSFGEDFGSKFIMAIIALILCLYDYKTNDQRKDYIWVFLVGTIIWSAAELALQLGGTRALQEKSFFGIDVTNTLWLTIPLQGMSEGAFVAVLGVFVGDRLLNKDKRKEGIIVLVIFVAWVSRTLLMGINFNNINAGDLSIPSRREMFPLTANIFIAIMSAIAILWLITTDPESRKRGLMMYIIMTGFIAWWTFTEWLTGQRWIEVGTINADGSYSNLRRAPPLIEFGALAYDFLIEVSLIYVPFLSIPYWFKLIKK
ncbi:MAG: hypothetical protein GF311_09615 [Candidatus Lokiarchaeota archaeon]|nr:hypothetical protein [Candidatus Lokiarchaeota archaeon]